MKEGGEDSILLFYLEFSLGEKKKKGGGKKRGGEGTVLARLKKDREKPRGE